MPMHDGHRQRLKERFLTEGLDQFTDVQVLELLLFYAVPRQDTNPIAHALLHRFGSLPQVLEASVEELRQVPGVGPGAATLLHLAPALGRYYQVSRTRNVRILTTLDACAEYMLPYFYGRTVETVYLLCLDAKCKVLCCREVGEGSVNSAGLSLRRIVETALSAKASSAVLAHNHPSGLAIPSSEDIQTTRRVAQALQGVDVQLVDHIIVGEDDYVSLAQSGSPYADCLWQLQEVPYGSI